MDPLGDFLRDLDPAYRAFIVIFFSAAIHSVLYGWWHRWKRAEEAKPTPMKLKKGVYVPWGRVERIRSVGHVIGWIWLAWIGVMLLAYVYLRLTGWKPV